tara:strand:+ start:8761 stop:8880 length:120 start_codon:yes stop_codon:yes gene_type:complete
VGRKEDDIEQIYTDTTKENSRLRFRAQYGIKEELRDIWN